MKTRRQRCDRCTARGLFGFVVQRGELLCGMCWRLEHGIDAGERYTYDDVIGRPWESTISPTAKRRVARRDSYGKEYQ